MRALVPLLLLTVACGPTAERFQNRFAKIDCAHMERCYPEEFYGWYGDMSTCRSELERAVEDITLYCEYDPPLARECLHEVLDLECYEQLPTWGPCMELFYCGYLY